MFFRSLSLGALVAFATISSPLNAGVDDGLWRDSAGDYVRTSAGECWQTGSRSASMPLPEACGGPPLDSDGDGVPDRDDRCPDTPAGTRVDANGCPPPPPKPADSDGDGVPDDRDRCPGTARGVKVDDSGCEILAKLVLDGRHVNFAFDKSNLNDSARSVLEGVAEQVRRNADRVTRVIVAGHTDSVGPERYNQRLSERRAAAVVGYLTGKGVESGVIESLGFGESSPIASNKNSDGRARNRRVEITFQTR